MFIDYLTLVMVNLVAGTVLLAYYVYFGMDAQDQKPYSVGFFMVGLMEVILGLGLSFNWPLPGSYNIAYGEATTLFGTVFLGAGIALSQGWDLMPMAIYAFFAGLDAIVVGIRIISLNLTQEPLLAGVGFIVAGLGGVLAAPTLRMLKKNKMMRTVGALVILASALIWAVTFYPALWAHLAAFAKWVPATMTTAAH